jgi:hypothetical protein
MCSAHSDDWIKNRDWVNVIPRFPHKKLYFVFTKSCAMILEGYRSICREGPTDFYWMPVGSSRYGKTLTFRRAAFGSKKYPIPDGNCSFPLITSQPACGREEGRETVTSFPEEWIPCGFDYISLMRRNSLFISSQPFGYQWTFASLLRRSRSGGDSLVKNSESTSESVRMEPRP